MTLIAGKKKINFILTLLYSLKSLFVQPVRFSVSDEHRITAQVTTNSILRISRCFCTFRITFGANLVRFVEGDPILHAIAEKLEDDFRVIHEMIRYIQISPSA